MKVSFEQSLSHASRSTGLNTIYKNPAFSIDPLRGSADWLLWGTRRALEGTNGLDVVVWFVDWILHSLVWMNYDIDRTKYVQRLLRVADST